MRTRAVPKGFNSPLEKLVHKLSWAPSPLILEGLPALTFLVVFAASSMFAARFLEGFYTGTFEYLLLMTFVIAGGMAIGLIVAMRLNGFVGALLFLLAVNLGIGYVETALVAEGVLTKPDLTGLDLTSAARIALVLLVVVVNSVFAFLLVHTLVLQSLCSLQRNLRDNEFGPYDYYPKPKDIFEASRIKYDARCYINDLFPDANTYNDTSDRKYDRITTLALGLGAALIAAIAYVAALAWIVSLITGQPMINLLDPLPLFVINVCTLGYAYSFFLKKHGEASASKNDNEDEKGGCLFLLFFIMEPFWAALFIYLIETHLISKVSFLYPWVFSAAFIVLPLGALFYCLLTFVQINMDARALNFVTNLLDEKISGPTKTYEREYLHDGDKVSPDHILPK